MTRGGRLPPGGLEALNERFRRDVDAAWPPGDVAAAALGVESEYAVYEDGRQVDFRTVIRGLAEGLGEELRPEGPFRYRRPNGTKFYSDGWYAELATPPEPLSPRAPSALAGAVGRGRNWLLDRLAAHSRRVGRSYTLSGSSMHLNVQAQGPEVRELAARFAVSYGPALVFMTGFPGSAGVLCHPRPGRVEVATEYIGDSTLLRAALSLAAGGVAALSAGGADGRHRGHSLPFEALEPSELRPGYDLRRSSVSPQLASAGRAAVLVTSDGRRITLQAFLESCWEALHPHLSGRLAPAELRVLADVVRGRRPGRIESPAPPLAVPLGTATRLPAHASAAERLFALALAPRRVGSWRLEPALTTWGFVLFAARSNGRTLFVNLPRRSLGLLAGAAPRRLARALDDFVAASAGGAALVARRLSDTERPGLFTAADSASLLTDAEAGGLGAPESLPVQQRPKPEHKRPVCQVIEHEDGTIEICIPATADPQRVLRQQEPAQNATVVAHGVWPHNGGLYEHHVDHHVRRMGFDFAFVRHYRSTIDYNGILGLGWDHGYNIRVVPDRPPLARDVPGGWCETVGMAGALTYHHGNGRVTRHDPVSSEFRTVRWCRDDVRGQAFQFRAVVTTYQQNPGESFEIERYAVLSPIPRGAIRCLDDPIFYRIRIRGGTRFILNCHGYIVQIRNRHHNLMCFVYGLHFNPSTLYSVLAKIIDTQGEEYALTYVIGADLQPRVETVTDFLGRVFRYEYDDRYQLTTVRLVHPDPSAPDDVRHRPTVGYAYQGRPGLLESVTAPVEMAGAAPPSPTPGPAPTGAPPAPGPAYIFVTWDNQERVERLRVGAPAGHTPPAGGEYRLRYDSASQVVLTDRVGVDWTYTLKPWLDSQVLEDLTVRDDVASGDQTLPDQAITVHYEYDVNYHVRLTRHPSGREEQADYRNGNSSVIVGEELDSVNPRFAHANDLSRDDMLRQAVVPAGGGPSFQTTYEYEPLFNSLEGVVTPLGRTVFRYDHGRCGAPQYNGNPVEITYPPQEQPLGPALAVVETFDYGYGGVRTLMVDADGVTNRYTHHEDGQIKEHRIGGKLWQSFEYDERGNLEERGDDRGNKWTYPEYDRRDNLRRMVDPLGHETRMTYDLNDRRTSTGFELRDDPSGLPGWTPQPARTIVEEVTFDLLGDRVRLTLTADPFLAGGGAPESRSSEWQYDGEERLILALSPNAVDLTRPDARVRHTYNRRGLPATLTAADATGLAGLADANPGTSTTVYTADGQAGIVSDPVGRTHVVTYDGYGRVATERWSNGTVLNRRYRGVQLEREWVTGTIQTGPPSLGGATLTDAVLRAGSYRCDRLQRVIRRTELVYVPELTTGTGAATTATIRTSYSPAGRVVQSQDPAGRSTVYHHDFAAQGQLSKVDLPGGHTVEYLAYRGLQPSTVEQRFKADPPPTLPGITAPPPAAPTPDLRTTEVRTFDGLGRLTSTVDALGVTTSYAYDSLGNVRAIDSPLGRRVNAYDGFARLREQTVERVASGSNPRGTIRVVIEYDANDNPVVQTNWLDATVKHRTVSDYDGRDLLVAVRATTDGDPFPQPLARLTRRADGRVTRVERGASRSMTYEYTDTGRVQRVVYRDGSETTEQAYGYDGLDRITWALDSNGSGPRERVQVYHTSDSLGRLVKERLKIPELGFDKSSEFRHDPGHRGRTVLYPTLLGGIARSVQGDDGHVKTILLDGLPLLVRAHQGPGRVLQTLHALEVTEGQPIVTRRWTLPLVEERDYDPEGRLRFRRLRVFDEINRPGQASALLLGAPERLEYGAHGAVERRETGSLFLDPAGGSVTTTFRYDGAARVVSSVEQLGTNRRERAYDWDGSSRLHRITTTDRQPGTAPRVITHTVAHRPQFGTRTDEEESLSIVWTFDAYGRLTQATGYLSRLVGVSSSMERTLRYDPADRLRRVDVRIPFTFSTERLEPEYLYDAFGRVVARVGGRASDAFADRERDVFMYDGRRIIAEFDKADALVRRYVYDDMGQVVSYRHREGGLTRELLPLTTLDGSPWLLVQRQIAFDTLPTPPGPAAAANRRRDYYENAIPLIYEQQTWRPLEPAQILRYDYSSGTATAAPVEASLLPLGAGGQRWMPKERLLYNLRRFYDPELRSFITPDVLGGWGDSRSFGNPYSSAGNNPVAFGDNGNLLIFGIPLGYVIGAVAAGGVITGVGYALTADQFDPAEFSAAVGIGGAAGLVSVFAFGLAAVGLGATATGTGLGVGGYIAASAVSGAAGSSLAGFVEGGLSAYGSSGGDWGRTLEGAGSQALAAGLYGALLGAVLTPAMEFAKPLIGRLAASALPFAVMAGDDVLLPFLSVEMESPPTVRGRALPMVPRSQSVSAYVHNAARDTGLIMVGGRIDQIKLPRSSWNSQNRSRKPGGGNDRRHGIPSSFMRHMIEFILTGADDPVAVLRRAGHDPMAVKTWVLNKYYGGDTMEARIFAAARGWYKRLHNVEANLWNGPAAENRTFGRFLGAFGRKIDRYFPQAFDVEGLRGRPEWNGWWDKPWWSG